MFEFIKDLIKPVLESVLKPILEWILSLPWWKRVVILILTVTTFLSIRYFEQVKNGLGYGIRAAQVVWAGGRNFPLRKPDQERLKNSIERLSSILKSNLHGKEFAGQAWTTAQILIAVEGKSAVDAKSVYAYLVSQMKADCS